MNLSKGFRPSENKRRKVMMRKKGFMIPILMLIVFIVGCNKSNAADEEKELNIGFNPGPYIDQFKLGIEPQLVKKGYEINYVDFTDGIQPNLSVDSEEIDANVFQHTIYMESINEEENINLAGAVQVPTPPMGLYSNKHQTLKDNENVVVAMPSDPVNMTRALTILEEIGWITLTEELDPLRVTENDVVDNPNDIEFRPMDSAQGPRALDDVDYVAVQGNYAVSSGLELTSALQQENMESPYVNVVAVKEENLEHQYVKDIVEAYHSEEFQEAILSNKQFDGYALPDYFTE